MSIVKYYMSDNVQQIKERLNIMDIISGYVRLQKAGVNYKALCPFHNEKTPSFMVSPSRQNWHCFGCSEGGDIFTFIEKIEGIDFLEALKILAEKAGVVLQHIDPKLRTEKDRIYEICEKATQFFTDSLNSLNSNVSIHQNDADNNLNNNLILNYLYKRGLKDKTIEEWRLGYAPDSWDLLLSFLGKYGYKESEIERAGLILKGNYSKYHDRFRNRLIFPIFDINGRVMAFSGRIMHDVISSKTEKIDSGKYINSPETILYNKSRTLYGLDKAKTEIRKANRVILVEGQMDVLLPWQDGVKNIIATSGTALTENQLSIIKRLTDNLIMIFDKDEAGFKATDRGNDLALGLGFNVSVLRLKSAKDAADFVKDHPGEFLGNIDQAEPFMSYYFNEIFNKFSIDKLEGKKLIVLAILTKINRLPSAVERDHWIRELSLKLGVLESDLVLEMEQLESPMYADDARIITDNQSLSAPDPQQSAPAKTRKEILSEKLLALLLKKPELIIGTIKAAAFLPKSDLEILGALTKSSNFSDIRSDLPQDMRARLDFLYLAGDYEMEKLGLQINLEEEATLLALDIEKEHHKERLAQIGWEIKRQESLENKDLDNLLKEFQNISKKIYEIEIRGKKI